MDDLIRDMAAAIQARETLPKMPPDLGLDEAYEMQKAVVAAASGGKLAGRKAGMTAPAAQQQLGISHPLLGSLYERGRMAPGVSFAGAPGIFLECEIGVVVDERGSPRTAGPVIEVPYMAFANAGDLTGNNLVACSIAADRFIVGRQLPLLDSYADIEVTLLRDGEVVCSAPATEPLGGPRQALDWMLRESRLRDFPVVDDMLFITGACGGLNPAKPGSYRADYGALGSIEFTVT